MNILKQFHLRYLVLFCSVSIIFSCTHGVYILGIDKSGEKEIKVKKEKYIEQIGKTLSDIHFAVLRSTDELHDPESEKAWGLAWFNIGVGIEGEVKVADILTLSARPRLRLYFKKKESDGLKESY